MEISINLFHKDLGQSPLQTQDITRTCRITGMVSIQINHKIVSNLPKLKLEENLLDKNLLFKSREDKLYNMELATQRWDIKPKRPIKSQVVPDKKE